MAKYNCHICGSEFDRVGNGIYCSGPHYRPCKVCGQPVEYSRPTDPYKCCSKECKLVLSNRTKSSRVRKCAICGKDYTSTGGVSKYCEGPHYTECEICGKQIEYISPIAPGGKPNTCSLECTKEKKRRTVQARYGVDNVATLAPVRDKISKKASSPERRKKVAATCQERYGVDNPAQAPEVREKMSKRMRTDTYLKGREATCLERYGHTTPMLNPEVQEKMRLAGASKGVAWPGSDPESRKKSRETNIAKYGVPHYFMSDESKAAQGNIISKLNRAMEARLVSEGLTTALEFRISDYSFDILVGDNLLLELNPTYTHNRVGNHWGEGKPLEYHKEKSRIAEEAGYRCIHIWDWDDVGKIVASLLPRRKVYARQCSLAALPEAAAKEFMDRFHLQGSCRGQKQVYGLYHKGELIQMMTFGKPRYNKKFQFELLRLATMPGYYVVGGAERLFKHFVSDHSPESIISYCDRSKFRGDVYSRLGFEINGDPGPSIIWSKGSQYITDNMLRQRGFDQLFDADFGKGTSNEQLMIDHGWLPVADCGQAVYTYRR